MAKKRKEQTDEEEFDFKLPKFDEEKFLKRERRNIKTMFIAFAFGLLVAVISFGFWALMGTSTFRWALVLLFGVFCAAWLRYIFLRLNIDLTDFGKKGWFGTISVYIFTWFVLLLLLVNPPFYDSAAPRVEAVILPEMQELGGTVMVIARITDNVGVKREGIKFDMWYNDSSLIVDDFLFENNIFSYTYRNTGNLTGEFTYALVATDVNGLKSDKVNGSFIFSNDTIRLASHEHADISPGPEVTYGTPVKFDVKPVVNRVYYTVNGGREINATKLGDYYETYPKYEGWPRDANVTVHVYASVITYFDQPTSLPPQAWSSLSAKGYNNTIVDSQTYYFHTGSDNIGLEKPPSVALPTPRFIQVPGFEAVLFIFALLCAMFLVKYRGKNQRFYRP